MSDNTIDGNGQTPSNGRAFYDRRAIETRVAETRQVGTELNHQYTGAIAFASGIISGLETWEGKLAGLVKRDGDAYTQAREGARQTAITRYAQSTGFLTRIVNRLRRYQVEWEAPAPTVKEDTRLHREVVRTGNEIKDLAEKLGKAPETIDAIFRDAAMLQEEDQQLRDQLDQFPDEIGKYNEKIETYTGLQGDLRQYGGVSPKEQDRIKADFRAYSDPEGVRTYVMPIEEDNLREHIITGIGAEIDSLRQVKKDLESRKRMMEYRLKSVGKQIDNLRQIAQSTCDAAQPALEELVGMASDFQSLARVAERGDVGFHLAESIASGEQRRQEREAAIQRYLLAMKANIAASAELRTAEDTNALPPEERVRRQLAAKAGPGST